MKNLTHLLRGGGYLRGRQPALPGDRFVHGAFAGSLVLLVFALLGSCDRPTAPRPDYTLIVEVAGHGKGTVTSQPAGIDCSAGSGTCSLTLPQGTQVTLTGTPDTRSEFGGWSQACSGTGACTVTLSSDQTVGATFDNPQLAAAEIGPSGGTVASRDGNLTLTFPAGALASPRTITVEEIPTSELGAEFSGRNVGVAYRLGPEGTTFDLPVTARLRSAQPLGAGDSVGVHPELLLSSSGGVLEPLDSLQMEIDGDRLYVTGELHHFSLLTNEVLLGVFMAIQLLTGQAGPDWRWSVEGLGRIYTSFNPEAPPITALAFTLATLQLLEAAIVLSPIPDKFRAHLAQQCLATQQIVTGTVLLLGFAALLTPEAQLYAGRTLRVVRQLQYACVQHFRVLLQKSGNGDGSFEVNGRICDIACAALVLYLAVNTEIVLRVTAASGSLFDGLGGDWSATPGEQEYRTVVTGPLVALVTFLAIRAALQTRNRRQLRYWSEVLVFAFFPAFAGSLAPTLDSGSPQSTSAPNGGRTVLATWLANGQLNTFDISDPANVQALDSLPPVCPSVRSAFIHESAYVPGLTITGVSPDNRALCSTSFPEPRGTGLVNWGNVPGSGAAILNSDGSLSHRYVVTTFDRSQVAIEDLRATITRRTVTLTPTRSCPFSVIATATHAFVVAREGVAGTSTATCNEHRGLYVVDVNTAQLEFAVPLGTKPREVVLSPNGSRAYVTDVEEDRIYVLNLGTRAVERTIATGSGPVGIAITADGKYLLVTNFNAQRLQLIEEATGEVVAEADSQGPQPVKVMLAPDGHTVVVLNYGDDDTDGSLTFYTLHRPDTP